MSYRRNNQYSDSPPPYSMVQSLGSQTSLHSPAHNSSRQPTHHLSREDSFARFIRNHKINDMFAERLKKIMGYDIVVICDDSGSMNINLNDAEGYPKNFTPSRWDELKRTLSVVIELAVTLDPDGIDIHFLNREPLRNITSPRQLDKTFDQIPSGPTPLAPVFRRVLHENREKINNGKLLVLIATDGEPTDSYGNPDVPRFKQVLERERVPIQNVPVTIIACTDDDRSMAYLNNWDRIIPNLDVVDDYKTELEEIKQCQGRSFPFSYGDYIVKILMGGIDSWFDNLDEVKVECDIRDDYRSPIQNDLVQFDY